MTASLRTRSHGEHEELAGEDGNSDGGTDDSDPFDDPTAGSVEDLDSDDEDELLKREPVDIKLNAQAEIKDGRRSFGLERPA